MPEIKGIYIEDKRQEDISKELSTDYKNFEKFKGYNNEMAELGKKHLNKMGDKIKQAREKIISNSSLIQKYPDKYNSFMATFKKYDKEIKDHTQSLNNKEWRKRHEVHINKLGSIIDNYENKAIQLIYELVEDMGDAEIIQTERGKVEQTNGKVKYVNIGEDGIYTLTKATNKPKIHQVLGNVLSPGEVRKIDYSECTNSRIKDRMATAISSNAQEGANSLSYSCFLNYDQTSKTYVLSDGSGHPISQRALIWEGVKLTPPSKIKGEAKLAKKEAEQAQIDKINNIELGDKDQAELLASMPEKMRNRLKQKDVDEFFRITEKSLNDVIKEAKQEGYELASKPISKYEGNGYLMKLNLINENAETSKPLIKNEFSPDIRKAFSKGQLKKYLTSRLYKKWEDFNYLTKNGSVLKQKKDRDSSEGIDKKYKEFALTGLSMLGSWANSVANDLGNTTIKDDDREFAAIKKYIRDAENDINTQKIMEEDIDDIINTLEQILLKFFKNNIKSSDNITGKDVIKGYLNEIIKSQNTNNQRIAIRKLGASRTRLDNSDTTFLRDEIQSEYEEVTGTRRKQVRDKNGNLQFDNDGNPIYEQAYDDEGNPLFDDDGNPIYVEEVTDKGIDLKDDDFEVYFQNIYKLYGVDNEDMIEEKKGNIEKLYTIVEQCQGKGGDKKFWMWLQEQRLLPPHLSGHGGQWKDKIKELKDKLYQQKKNVDKLNITGSGIKERTKQELAELQLTLTSRQLQEAEKGNNESEDPKIMRLNALNFMLAQDDNFFNNLAQEELKEAEKRMLYMGVDNVVKGTIGPYIIRRGGGINSDDEIAKIYNDSVGAGGWLDFSDEGIPHVTLTDILIEIAITAVSIALSPTGAGVAIAVARQAAKSALKTSVKAAVKAFLKTFMKTMAKNMAKKISTKAAKGATRATTKVLGATAVKKVGEQTVKQGFKQMVKGSVRASVERAKNQTLKSVLVHGTNLAVEGTFFHFNSTILHNAINGEDLLEGCDPFGYTEGPNGERIPNYRGYLQSIAFLGVLKSVGGGLQTITGDGAKALLKAGQSASVLNKAAASTLGMLGEMGGMMATEQILSLTFDQTFTPITGESFISMIGMIVGLRFVGKCELKIKEYNGRRTKLEMKQQGTGNTFNVYADNEGNVLKVEGIDREGKKIKNPEQVIGIKAGDNGMNIRDISNAMGNKTGTIEGGKQAGKNLNNLNVGDEITVKHGENNLKLKKTPEGKREVSDPGGTTYEKGTKFDVEQNSNDKSFHLKNIEGKGTISLDGQIDVKLQSRFGTETINGSNGNWNENSRKNEEILQIERDLQDVQEKLNENNRDRNELDKAEKDLKRNEENLKNKKADLEAQKTELQEQLLKTPEFNTLGDVSLSEFPVRKENKVSIGGSKYKYIGIKNGKLEFISTEGKGKKSFSSFKELNDAGLKIDLDSRVNGGKRSGSVEQEIFNKLVEREIAQGKRLELEARQKALKNEINDLISQGANKNDNAIRQKSAELEQIETELSKITKGDIVQNPEYQRIQREISNIDGQITNTEGELKSNTEKLLANQSEQTRLENELIGIKGQELEIKGKQKEITEKYNQTGILHENGELGEKAPEKGMEFEDQKLSSHEREIKRLQNETTELETQLKEMRKNKNGKVTINGVEVAVSEELIESTKRQIEINNKELIEHRTVLERRNGGIVNVEKDGSISIIKPDFSTEKILPDGTICKGDFDMDGELISGLKTYPDGSREYGVFEGGVLSIGCYEVKLPEGGYKQTYATLNGIYEVTLDGNHNMIGSAMLIGDGYRTPVPQQTVMGVKEWFKNFQESLKQKQKNNKARREQKYREREIEAAKALTETEKEIVDDITKNVEKIREDTSKEFDLQNGEKIRIKKLPNGKFVEVENTGGNERVKSQEMTNGELKEHIKDNITSKKLSEVKKKDGGIFDKQIMSEEGVLIGEKSTYRIEEIKDGSETIGIRLIESDGTTSADGSKKRTVKKTAISKSNGNDFRTTQEFTELMREYYNLKDKYLDISRENLQNEKGSRNDVESLCDIIKRGIKWDSGTELKLFEGLEEIHSTEIQACLDKLVLLECEAGKGIGVEETLTKFTREMSGPERDYANSILSKYQSMKEAVNNDPYGENKSKIQKRLNNYIDNREISSIIHFGNDFSREVVLYNRGSVPNVAVTERSYTIAKDIFSTEIKGIDLEGKWELGKFSEEISKFNQVVDTYIREKFNTEGLQELNSTKHRAFYDHVVKELGLGSGVAELGDLLNIKGIQDCRLHAFTKQLLFDTWRNTQIKKLSTELGKFSEGSPEYETIRQKLLLVENTKMEIVTASFSGKVDMDGMYAARTSDGYMLKGERNNLIIEEHTFNMIEIPTVENGKVTGKETRFADSFYHGNKGKIYDLSYKPNGSINIGGKNKDFKMQTEITCKDSKGGEYKVAIEIKPLEWSRRPLGQSPEGLRDATGKYRIKTEGDINTARLNNDYKVFEELVPEISKAEDKIRNSLQDVLNDLKEGRNFDPSKFESACHTGDYEFSRVKVEWDKTKSPRQPMRDNEGNLKIERNNNGTIQLGKTRYTLNEWEKSMIEKALRTYEKIASPKAKEAAAEYIERMIQHITTTEGNEFTYKPGDLTSEFVTRESVFLENMEYFNKEIFRPNFDKALESGNTTEIYQHFEECSNNYKQDMGQFIERFINTVTNEGGWRETYHRNNFEKIAKRFNTDMEYFDKAYEKLIESGEYEKAYKIKDFIVKSHENMLKLSDKFLGDYIDFKTVKKVIKGTEGRERGSNLRTIINDIESGNKVNISERIDSLLGEKGASEKLKSELGFDAEKDWDVDMLKIAIDKIKGLEEQYKIIEMVYDPKIQRMVMEDAVYGKEYYMTGNVSRDKRWESSYGRERSEDYRTRKEAEIKFEREIGTKSKTDIVKYLKETIIDKSTNLKNPNERNMIAGEIEKLADLCGSMETIDIYRICKLSSEALIYETLESNTRNMGDHGINHIKGNIDKLNNYIDSYSKHRKISGEQVQQYKLMGMLTHIFHDIGYAAEISRGSKSFDGSAVHPSTSKVFFDSNIRPLLEKSGINTDLISKAIESHDGIRLDFSNPNEAFLSFVNLSDNMALGVDKISAIWGNPKFLKYVSLLGAAGKAGINIEDMRGKIIEEIDNTVSDKAEKDMIKSAIYELNGRSLDNLDFWSISSQSTMEFGADGIPTLSMYRGRNIKLVAEICGIKYEDLRNAIKHGAKNEIIRLIKGTKFGKQIIKPLGDYTDIYDIRGENGELYNMKIKDIEKGTLEYELDGVIADLLMGKEVELIDSNGKTKLRYKYKKGNESSIDTESNSLYGQIEGLNEIVGKGTEAINQINKDKGIEAIGKTYKSIDRLEKALKNNENIEGAVDILIKDFGNIMGIGQKIDFIGTVPDRLNKIAIEVTPQSPSWSNVNGVKDNIKLIKEYLDISSGLLVSSYDQHLN